MNKKQYAHCPNSPEIKHFLDASLGKKLLNALRVLISSSYKLGDMTLNQLM